jgi:long-chain acyl-CoA synthetase
MAAPPRAPHEIQLPRGTLVELLLGAIDRLRDADAFNLFSGAGPELTAVSYRAFQGWVKDGVGALAELGLGRGDRAAILSENRFEWALVDYASLFAGVIDVPIHSTLTADQVGFILEDSGAKVVFASSAEQVAKARAACAKCTQPPVVVAFDADAATGGALSWTGLLERGHTRMSAVSDEELRASARTATPDDVATILYTSGTTGQPKWVVLTHQNLFSNVEAASFALRIDASDSTLSFLPLSHIFQRMVDYLLLSRG